MNCTGNIFRVDKKHLPYEIEQHPKRVAEYSEWASELSLKMEKTKARYEYIYNSIYIKYRESLVNENSKLMSENYLQAKTKTHTKVKEALKNFLEMQKKFNNAKGIN